MTSHGAHRAFTMRCTVARTMRLLAHVPLGGERALSWRLPKHCPVVLLALAAHHDQDAVIGTMPGYTAAELAPFAGLAAGTVAEALRGLLRFQLVSRYAGDRGAHRYTIRLHAFVDYGSETTR
jgi:hypothetical protein